MVKKRTGIERQMRRMLGLDGEKNEATKGELNRLDTVDSLGTGETIGESAEDVERNRAATTIQTGVRRWLIRRRNRRPLWSRPLMAQNTLTEATVRRLQEELELRLQRQQPPPPRMAPQEQQELHQRAQLMYARFSRGLARRRLGDHRAAAAAAQAEAAADLILEDAPPLSEYDASRDWSRFHVPPIP